MNEQDFIDQAYDLWPKGDTPSTALVQLLDDAVRACPCSSELWALRGDIFVLQGISASALTSYERAIELAPSDIEALESLGFLLDASFDRADDAERCFRQAIALGGSADAYAGLARLLAERGERGAALELLGDRCPFADEDPVVEMRRQIIDGIWCN